MSTMFLECLIFAALGLGSVILSSFLGDGPNTRDLATIGAGMVGAALGVWNASRQVKPNGTPKPPRDTGSYVSLEIEPAAPRKETT